MRLSFHRVHPSKYNTAEEAATAGPFCENCSRPASVSINTITASRLLCSACYVQCNGMKEGGWPFIQNIPHGIENATSELRAASPPASCVAPSTPRQRAAALRRFLKHKRG